MRRLIFAAFVLVLINGCKKSNSSHSTTPITIPTQPAVQTPVGTPTGAPVTVAIGPAGGTVLSADGRVELNFPANAVATSTNITIQPVTNTAPNGSGVGYRYWALGSQLYLFASPPIVTEKQTSDLGSNGTGPITTTWSATPIH